MSGDTKYRDGIVGGNGTLGGSKWKEDGVNIRLDKDFNDKQSLKVWYNFKEGKDGYPIAVPNLKYWNEKDWNDIIFKATVGQLDANNKLIGGTLTGDARNPGYHNLYALDGQVYGSFSRFKNNDWDIQYIFDKDNGMESFIRVYDQNHRYAHRDKYQWYVNGRDAGAAYAAAFPDGATNEQLSQWIADNLAPFPDGDQNKVQEWLEKTGGVAQEPTSWREEKNRGVQLQYAKSVGVNDIIASVTYDKSKNFSKKRSTDGSLTESHVTRSSVLGYIQDKIHLSDKWDITPAIRYSKYSSFDTSNASGTTKGKGDTHLLTPVINTQYMFDDTSSMYFGWTKVFRPLKQGDYTSVDGVFHTPLEDEKGDAWTLGYKKDLSDKTSVAIHYDWTRMSNAIATLPILDIDTGDITRTAVNAKEEKKSFNLTLDHQFDDHFTLSASYSHMKDKWKAKKGWILDSSWGYSDDDDINTAINSLRPANHYALNLSYENGKLYTGLLTNWYTGCSEHAFTDKQFLVLDWNINYEVTKDLTAYALVTNLTNEAYETSYNSWNGVGSSAMPGRCFMIGMKYKF